MSVKRTQEALGRIGLSVKEKTEDQKIQEVLDRLDRKDLISEIEESLAQLWKNYRIQPSSIITSLDSYLAMRKMYEKKSRRASRKTSSKKLTSQRVKRTGKVVKRARKVI